MAVLLFTRISSKWSPRSIRDKTAYIACRFICLDKQIIDFANTAINRPDMKGEHDIFNRVMPRDNIAVVTFLENRQSGERMMVVNAHVTWDPNYKDVKLVQTAILMEQITKLSDSYTKIAPCKDKSVYKYTDGDTDGDSVPQEPRPEPGPSLSYAKGEDIPVIMCGDFNSTPDSGVYDLIAHSKLPHNHPDFGDYKYGNFTRDDLNHAFKLKSSYSHINELSFTNYTPGFTGVIDYIWYSTKAYQVVGLLGEVDREYLQRVPGFPNYHFPSDHLALMAEFVVKGRKDTDFGLQRDRIQ
jgi:CCR4-NOT transcription complex subunit 6